MHEVGIAKRANDQAGAKYAQLIVAAASDHPEPPRPPLVAFAASGTKGAGKVSK
jgi:hypothetical protein